MAVFGYVLNGATFSVLALNRTFRKCLLTASANRKQYMAKHNEAGGGMTVEEAVITSVKVAVFSAFK